MGKNYSDLYSICRTRCSWRWQTTPSVPPPGELDETYLSSLILAYSLHYMKTWHHPQNRKYITHRSNCHQRRTNPRSQLTCKENYSENLVVWFLRCVNGQTNKQTNRQKNMRTAILCTPTMGKPKVTAYSYRIPSLHKRV